MGLLLLAAAGFARLGVWQLGRLHERRAANRHHGGGAPRAAGAIDARTRRGTDRLAERHVVARGRYDPAHEIIIRGDVLAGSSGRSDGDAPAARAGEDPAVLVDRGFLPTPDAVTVDPRGAEEPGELEVARRRAAGAERPGRAASSTTAGSPGGGWTWRRCGRACRTAAADPDQAEPRQRAATLPPAARAAADGRGAASGLRGAVVSVRRPGGGVRAAGRGALRARGPERCRAQDAGRAPSSCSMVRVDGSRSRWRRAAVCSA